MMSKSARFVVMTSKRQMLSIVGESPRITIAKNILSLSLISRATDESSLAEAAKSSMTINAAALQPELKGLEGYLAAAPAAGTAFVKDPTAWQNMELSAMVQTEAGRADTWPFLVGGA